MCAACRPRRSDHSDAERDVEPDGGVDAQPHGAAAGRRARGPAHRAEPHQLPSSPSRRPQLGYPSQH